MPSDPYPPLPGYDVEDRHRGDYLPTYTPALPTPYYTVDPHPDEARLHLSIGSRHTVTEDLTHVFTEKTKHFSLTLTNQPPACTTPTYGRGTAIQGFLNVFKPDDVASILLKVCLVFLYIVSSSIHNVFDSSSK